MQTTTCPIWGTQARQFPTMRDGRDLDLPCAGGRYAISGTAGASWPELDDQQSELLTRWIAAQHRAGEANPLITDDVLVSVIGRSLGDD